MARENALAETVQRIQCLIIMKSYPLKVKGKNYPSFYLNSVISELLTGCCVGLILVSRKEQQQEI